MSLELLQALAALDEDGRGVALPRLAKHLDRRVSLLLREYTLLGDMRLGEAAGPGWVALVCDADGRWTAHLTPAGQRQLAGLVPLEVWRDAQAEVDPVAVETPVALVFNGISQAVMMATPTDLEDFALGFALSEGLLLARSECRGIELQQGPQGIELHLEVAAAAEVRLKQRRRMLAGRTGCGLCGVESLQQLELQALAPLTRPPWVEALDGATLARAFAQLPDQQPLHAQTGAQHAAGWATPEGELLFTMEDVGRHNALDKLLGRLLREAEQAPQQGLVLMSSRASYELVRKCVRLGVPVLATVSAPTSLAVQIARQAGLRLYGFCRGTQALRYSD